MTQDQTQASNFVADLAERYAALVISKWAARGLPVAALAAELLVSGLRETTRHERPGNVAESLERMADAIRDGSQGWRETVN
ncbi:hypothetical protein [Caulobacter sp. DWP3-1-3b2]|uniref:hypothetical protein n=1 Tax=Caulobacter sp. DWP3-1-3b2 TaxID=2804643 RepID=UPI003CE95F82